MKIDEFTKQQGEFLKAEIVEQFKNTLFEIVGEATVEHNDKYDTDRLWIPVRVEDKEFTFDCSRTNARVIEASLGSDTAKWIGKFLTLETYKTKTSDGRLVNAINVKMAK